LHVRHDAQLLSLFLSRSSRNKPVRRPLADSGLERVDPLLCFFGIGVAGCGDELV